MNAQTPGSAERQILAIQIAALDFEINKLQKWYNAGSLKVGSLMLSGKSAISVEFHELVVWNSHLPIPEKHLKEFINSYCADLIAQRLYLLMEAEGKQQGHSNDQLKQDVRDPLGSIETGHCPHCAKETTHTLRLLDPDKPEGFKIWVCDQCEMAIEVE